MDKLGKGRLFGRFFAASRVKLREVAERLDLAHVRNLAGWPTAMSRLNFGVMPIQFHPCLVERELPVVCRIIVAAVEDGQARVSLAFVPL